MTTPTGVTPETLVITPTDQRLWCSTCSRAWPPVPVASQDGAPCTSCGNQT